MVKILASQNIPRAHATEKQQDIRVRFSVAVFIFFVYGVWWSGGEVRCREKRRAAAADEPHPEEGACPLLFPSSLSLSYFTFSYALIRRDESEIAAASREEGGRRR